MPMFSIAPGKAGSAATRPTTRSTSSPVSARSSSSTSADMSRLPDSQSQLRVSTTSKRTPGQARVAALTRSRMRRKRAGPSTVWRRKSAAAQTRTRSERVTAGGAPDGPSRSAAGIMRRTLSRCTPPGVFGSDGSQSFQLCCARAVEPSRQVSASARAARRAILVRGADVRSTSAQYQLDGARGCDAGHTARADELPRRSSARAAEEVSRARGDDGGERTGRRPRTAAAARR